MLHVKLYIFSGVNSHVALKQIYSDGIVAVLQVRMQVCYWVGCHIQSNLSQQSTLTVFLHALEVADWLPLDRASLSLQTGRLLLGCSNIRSLGYRTTGNQSANLGKQQQESIVYKLVACCPGSATSNQSAN